MENYSHLEIVILLISYIGLSFLAGCSSTLALKEYMINISDYVPYDEYKERPYKEKYRDDYRNNYNYKERERHSPYYNKYDRYEKYDSK